ncbi:MAG: membrane protease YdiL (CAAX protease family) [Patiriisocius sp.]
MLAIIAIFIMLQRIQTIYLIIAALIMAALYIWFPVVTNAAGETIISNQEPLVFGLIFTSIALAIIAVLTFKKRQTQFVLNRLNIILNFVLLGVFVYRSLNISGETLVSEKGIGVLLPILSIVFLAVANKAIKKDEDLVKSVDRLR